MIHALLRFGKFTSITTMPTIVPQIQILVVSGNPIMPYDELPEQSVSGYFVMIFRLNRKIDGDLAEYVYDHIEVKENENA